MNISRRAYRKITSIFDEHLCFYRKRLLNNRDFSIICNNWFEYDYKSQGSYWYKGGSFAGYNDCKVIVKAYDNLVYEVVAILPTQYRWNHLYNDYCTLVSSLKKKYGEPDYSKEEFVNTPSYKDLDDDNDKYSEVKDDHCNYYTGFSVGYGLTGSVHIEIKASGCVGLHYTDGYNKYLKARAVENDL